MEVMMTTPQQETSASEDSSLPDPLDTLVQERRRHLGPEAEAGLQPGRWGLALSGGGVRSATFCYGLVSALAKNGVFSRFDYMSTVSGGGYIGAMIGRLAQKADTADELQKKLASREDTRIQRWLRSNSRYLMPRGSRDSLFAVTTFLRNLLAIHLELGLLGILLGCILGGIDILAWWGLDRLIQADPEGAAGPWGQIWEFVSRFPTLWLALVIPLAGGAVFTAQYWLSPSCGRGLDGDKRRRKVTGRLVGMLTATVVIFLLGGIDWVAWRIANKGDVLARLGVGFALALPALRALLPLAQNGESGSPVSRLINMSMLIDVAGRVTMIALAVFWTAVVHWACTQKAWAPDASQADFATAAKLLAIVAGISVVWILITSFHLDFLNRSSLHHFYRSRLTNTYLGAANEARDEQPYVKDHHDNDDTLMSKYTPHAHGGPVHMVNVCVNQTFQKHGLFNIDRQGEMMTVVGPDQCRVEGKGWSKIEQGGDMSLGAWMAISGAAAAPGMGSGSRPGWAALLMTLGIRLGYWWDSGGKRDDSPRLARYAPKYTYLLSELLGLMPGSARHVQYLSDGGHCENTGVYPLLRQKCALIVAADCGADPEYRFDDLENLLRRARIDLDIDIRFIKPDGSLPCLGTLDDIALKKNSACMAVAIITYKDGQKGTLVLVKPTLMRDLPEDLHNYYRDHRTFPQQSTADQFFSEDQWESYFSLGRHIGTYIDDPFFAQLEKLVSAPPVYSSSDTKQAQSPSAAAEQRLPLRIGAQAVATSTLGIGTLFVATTGVWTAFQQGAGGAPVKELDPDLLRPLYAMYADLPLTASAQSEALVARLAAEVMYVWEKAKAGHQEAALQSSPVVTTIFKTAAERCYTLRERYAACGTLLSADASCPRPQATESLIQQRKGYWVRYDAARRDKTSRIKSYCEEASWKNELADIALPTNAAVSSKPRGELLSHTGANVGAIMRAPVPVAGGNLPSSTSQAVPVKICQGMNIFIQIYGPAGRDNVRVLRTFWREAGASVPPIEDVNATSARQGRNPPDQFAKPTIIYHTESKTGVNAKQCAQQLAALAQQPVEGWIVKPLASNLTASKNTIEVWLPPVAVVAGFDQWLTKGAYCRQERSGDGDNSSYAVRCYPTRASCSGDAAEATQARSGCDPVNQQDLTASLPYRSVSGGYYNIGQAPFPAPFPALGK
jgi:hypothetical protein